MKKRIGIAAVAAVLAIALIVVLFLRSGGSQTVGICYRDNTGSDNTPFRTALEQALTEQGLQLIVTDADGDQAKQLTLIQQLADQKCSAILVEPVMSDADEALVSALTNARLPVVLFNREVSDGLLNACPKAMSITMDTRQAGTLQGEMVQGLPDGGDLNGDGVTSYLLIQGPVDHSRAVQQGEGLQAALSGGSVKVEQLVVGYGDWTLDSGRKICRQELAAYGKDIEVILCGNDQMAMGAAQAIADGGRTVGKDVYLFGIDGEADAFRMIREGTMTGTVYSNELEQIRILVETVLLQIKNQTVSKRQQVPYVAVTAENVQQYE